MNNQQTTSPLKKLMFSKVTQCAGRILANTRPHRQWHDREMRMAISYTQNTVRWLALSKRLVEIPRKYRLFA